MSTTATTSSTTNRIVLDYTSRDYKAIRSMLVGLAKGIMPDWQTVGETGDFGTLLLELYAYMGDVMHYYIDRLASEAFLGTAVRRQSIMYIADMFGYTPLGQRAATVPLTFTWQWDEASLPGGAIPVYTYNVDSASVANGVVTMTLSSDTYAIHMVEGQTISVSGVGTPYDGQFVVQSVVSDPNTTTVDITYNVVSSATGTASVTVSSVVTTGSVVIIPAKTPITTAPDSLGNVTVFELNFDVVLDTQNKKAVSTGSTVYSVSQLAAASEGYTVSPVMVGISKGIPNAEFVLPDSGVIDRTVTVYTKEANQIVSWSRVDKMSLATPTQSVYTTYVDDQNYTHVMFGDNASGRIPPTNVEIYVGYRYGVGASANDLGVNTINVLNNDFATQNGVTVTNTSSPVGGADVESVESMRYSIPRASALKQRAVTIDDYVNLALQVPGITKATAYGQNYTTVYVRIASNAQSTGYVTTNVGIKYVNSGTATVSMADSLNLTVGQVAYATNVGTNLNGSVTITAVWYSGLPIDVVYRSLTSNVATICVSSLNGLVVGQPITVAGIDSTFNGTFVISSITYDSVNTRYNISYAKTHADVTGATTSGATVTKTAGISYATTASNILEAQTVSSGTVTTTSPEMQLLINSLESYLSDKKLIGSVVYGEPVEWTNVDMAVAVQVLPLYNRESVREAVQSAIENVFSYDNVDFGKRISIGDVYRAALGVEGVDYVTLSKLKIVGDVATVEDINTPVYNLPRVYPSIASNWVTATGGLVNT